jgi:Protein of unknown function (DUF1553)/Protein of unknown function (DUF1549)/Concanavalin A-like lectin/glucanases superfamily/Planctomycete cytochrome C
MMKRYDPAPPPARAPMKSLPLTLALIALTPLAGFAQTANRANAPKIDFNRHVRPILSENCFKCHGPDAKARQAELRLDDQRSAKRVFESTPGKLSEFVKRITSRDPDVKMPPPSSKKKLTPTEIATLKRWAQQGAKYDKHWAFEPVRPVVVPKVKLATWPRNEIDRFVLRRIERRGLSPSPEANKETLIRRLSFDLTGLPPTLKEIGAFLADKSPAAYEKLVDRLLASQAYGERMAAVWMDVARYSDSYGYQVDRDRFVWPWRDWVVKAFNRNMPYDRFITWQLAGDLLPHASDEQILATTFNRLHSQKVEGGSVPEEFRIEYVADRTQTFATAFLGLTLECCRCHDHKFDPLKQKEYYQFSAFFDNIDEAGLYSYFTPAVPTPTLWLTDAAMKKRIADVRDRISAAERELKALESSRRESFEKWLKLIRQTDGNSSKTSRNVPRIGLTTKPRVATEGSAPWVVGRRDAVNPERVPQRTPGTTRARRSALSNPVGVGFVLSPHTQGALASLATLGFVVSPLRGGRATTRTAKSTSIESPSPLAHLDFEKTNIGGNARVPGKFGKCVKLTGDDEVHLKVGNFRRYEPFSISLWMNTPKHFPRAVVFHRSRAWTDAGSRGYELLIEDGKLSAALIHFYPGNAIRVRTKERIPLHKWLHVTVTYDGSSRADGLKIYVHEASRTLPPAAVTVVRDKLTKNITGGGGDNITIGARFRDQGFTNGLVDEFQVFNRELTPIEVAQLHDGKSLRELLAATRTLKASGSLTAAQREQLFRFYLHTVDGPYRKQLAALKKVREERSKLVDGIPEIMVMRDRKRRRPTYLLIRGAYDKHGPRVEAGTPAIFPPFPKDAPHNRLGLAKWLTDPRHPLTSRVEVNRLWQLLFGNGLVRTPEDFGSQGQPPTHPELLDWLAADFMRHGWDVKRTLKLIVMSATYRQSSVGQAFQPDRVSAQSTSTSRHGQAGKPDLRIDPENKLLARAPSYRLPAEMLRDNALAVSGLLVRRIGGPPAKPYEVTVSFKPVGRDKGDGLYRRSLYTYWKRTAPAPVMLTLDASKREVCEVKRETTSSPLQALVLLNGPQFAEAARVLAQRLIQQHGERTDAILTDMFRLLTSRRPKGAELKLLRDLYIAELGGFEKNPQRAAALLKTGDAKVDAKIAAPRLAALAVVANTLFNYDECVMKR